MRSFYEMVELTLDDLPNCSSFWGYPNARLESFLKNGTRRVFAYKTDDMYVGGCALIVGDNQHGHFSDFFMRSDLRGQGIGSRMLAFAIGYFKDRYYVLKSCANLAEYLYPASGGTAGYKQNFSNLFGVGREIGYVRFANQ